MNEPDKPTLLERLSSLLLREPEDRDQLIELLHSAFERRLLDAEALSMIEGVLQVSETQVRDVMIPRSQMDMLDVAESPAKFIPFVIETAHSRFPVFEDNRDNVIGILLAKDLLRFYAESEFNFREMLRPSVFVPEAKRLNVLLKEFRAKRNHIAIVVDEYGGVSSKSYSSSMSPTICSITSSMVTSPETPPYSSTTMAMWLRLARNSFSRTFRRLASGTKTAGRSISRTLNSSSA